MEFGLCHLIFVSPVEQEVMVDLLRVPYQTGELKNVKHDWKYTSVSIYFHVLEKNILFNVKKKILSIILLVNILSERPRG